MQFSTPPRKPPASLGLLIFHLSGKLENNQYDNITQQTQPFYTKNCNLFV